MRPARRSSTSYEKVVESPLWIASRTSDVNASTMSNETTTCPSRAMGVTVMSGASAACTPVQRTTVTTKTRKHEENHEENQRVFFFVSSWLRGPGSVLILWG